MLPPNAESSLRFVVHPPERNQSRAGVPALSGAGCCCCCCCCLHTVGSILGAAVAPLVGARRRLRTQEQRDYDDLRLESQSNEAQREPEEYRGRNARSAVLVFWQSSGVLVLLAVLAGAVSGLNKREVSTNLILAGVALVLGFPALQLVGVIITLIVLGITGGTNVGSEYRRVGRIALGIFLGGLAGMLIMVVGGIVLSML